MPKPVKLITWGTEYSEMLAEMGILEGEQSRFIRLLIDEAYRRFRAGNPVSVVDAMLSDTSVSEKAGNKRTDRQTLVLLAAAWWEHALIDLQNGRREAEKTNYSRRFEKRTATGFKSRPPNFVKLAVQT